MSSTPPDPVPPSSSSPAHQVNNLAQNSEGNDDKIQQPEGAKPPPPASPQARLQEPPSMESFSIPPFWATTRDSDLTAALINAQRSERRAESRLIRMRLKRIKVELDLYNHMEKRTADRLRKADTGVGVTSGVQRLSGFVGKTFDHHDCLESDASTRWHESDVEA